MGAPTIPPKRVHLSAAAALAKRFRFGAAFSERERKGGMKDVARGERVDCLDREGLLPLQGAAIVPQRARRALRHRDEAAAKGGCALERSGEVAGPGRRAHRLGCKNRVRSEREQRIGRLSRRLVDV